MNKLSLEDRAKILHLLCEGMSIRAVTRLTGKSKNTVAKLLVDAGKACATYHDANVLNVKAARVQVDEIWSFTYAKQKNVASTKEAPEGAGDTWTWTALDADSKLIVSYLVGGRDAEYAMWFMDYLAARLANRVQLTSDGHRAYLETVEGAFGCDVDFAQLVKMYGATIDAPGRYSPAECTGSKKIRREGNPDIAHVSTSYVERQNLTIRMLMRRFTRLTNAFLKKIENHAHAVALHMMYYNFVRIHKTLRVTPAMASGVADRLWEIADIAKLVEDAEAVPKKRGSYKKNRVRFQTDPLLTILLIDDNPAVSRAMEIAFRMAGHVLDTASGPEEAFSRLALQRYDAILLDMNFTAGESSGAQGLACLARIMTDDPAACVVVLTAHSGIRIAVAAMQAGARDFAMKPWRNAELVARVEAAIARAAIMIPAAPRAVTGTGPVRLLGDSPAMHGLRDLVRRVGPTPAGVAVTGRSGSGRTLTALAIHAASSQADTVPVRIDLRDAAAWGRLDQTPAGINATAILRYPDLLDTVAQARLLDHISADLRCITIADSLAPLSSALRRRLATVEIAVPALVERRDDAVLLARHFARVAAERFGRPQVRLTEAAETAIRTAFWPDEVRGLALAIERAVLLSHDGLLDAAGLATTMPAIDAVARTTDTGFDLTDAEKAMIDAALREHRHNVTHAAAALGLSRGALYRRMARYGL